MAAHATERQVPIGLVIAGAIAYMIAGLRSAGPAGVPVALGIASATAILGTGLMLVAAFITAGITRQSFGDFRAAVLKLAGIYIFSSGIAALIPGAIGVLISDACYFSLLLWLFELEVPYAVVFTLVMMAIQLAVAFLVAGSRSL